MTDLSLPGAVRLPRCDDCCAAHWYPKGRCPRCGGTWTWREVSAQGLVFSWTTVHHDFGSTTPSPLPVTVVLATVSAEPGIRLVAVAADCLPPEGLAVDHRVHIVEIPSTDGEQTWFEAHQLGCSHRVSG